MTKVIYFEDMTDENRYEAMDRLYRAIVSTEGLWATSHDLDALWSVINTHIRFRSHQPEVIRSVLSLTKVILTHDEYGWEEVFQDLCETLIEGFEMSPRPNIEE
jgi:hypothetical protein